MAYKSMKVQPEVVSFSSVLVNAIKEAGFEVVRHKGFYHREQIAFALRKGESATGAASTIVANIEDSETRKDVACAFQHASIDARTGVSFVVFSPHLEVPDKL